MLPLILASSSPDRLKLLKQIGISPSQLIPSNIDETPLPKELPSKLAKRLAELKGIKVAKQVEEGYIVAADTVCAAGRRILDKAETDETVEEYLKLLSGRRHKIYTGFAVYLKRNNEIVKSSSQVVESVIKLKRLSADEIKKYILSKEGIGKSGGMCISGLLQAYTTFISGSISNIIGLPLHELYKALTGLGYKL